MSKIILKEIIDESEFSKFISFFRSKNDKLNFPNKPLPINEDNFFKARLIAEGKLEDGNLIICTICVRQPLSERTGKKAQYDLGKKILKENVADAGIFIFYDDNNNFRFSLIYANYLGQKRDWSTFRRFTYFVSPELTNKTFLQRIGEGALSNLEEIKEAFSVEKVTREFYQEIANWYFWAIQKSKFPDDVEKDENGRNVAIIRLITRVVFIWFMKVRGLIPDELFDLKNIQEILKDVSLNESTYYKAILQNLFFATLNTKQQDREFRSEIRGHKGYNPDFGNHNVYRYHVLFKEPEKIKEYFGKIPFLNGGLFDCFDYKSKDKDVRIYIDGFTDVKQHQPNIPNLLFFGEESNIDLNREYGTKGKRYKARGLIDILSSYNFTIDENDPDDFEVALDPELLGRVFENLLASYNPETSSTARKATGSYNTPREIVDYMVTQSIFYYLKIHLHDTPDIEKKLSDLFLKECSHNPFDANTTQKVISLIERLRIVDPAVGSGAFPMGILNKLVFILSKIDPKNTLWKQTQIEAINRNIKDPFLKESLIQQTYEYFRNKDINYLRKLYLIQKCIYGVDIQQIAVEIAKLRFFISLLVDEKLDDNKENRGIEPLPNLDFKLMQGNSLISSFDGIDLRYNGLSQKKKQFSFTFKKEYDDLIKEFEDTKNKFQHETDKKKRDFLLDKIEGLILQIFKEKLMERLPALKETKEPAFVTPNPKDQEKYITIKRQEFAKKYGFEFEEAEKELMAYNEGRKPKNFFLWDVYFAEVFTGENPGFDIVIANPPYGNLLTKKEKNIINNNFLFSTLSDISSPFIEQCFNILKNQGSLIFIINYAITFSKIFSKSRELIAEGFADNYIYTFDRDKCKIFQHATQSVSIMKCFNKNSFSKNGIYTSRMFRESPSIYEIKVSNCNKYLFPKKSSYYESHRLPKIGENINKVILDKLLFYNNHVVSILSKSGGKIWIRTSGNYWYNAFDKKPYNSTEISPLFVEKDFIDFLTVLMNSSLFYFWLRIYGDGRHMNKDILKYFPLPNREKILTYNILLNKSKERFMVKLFSVFDKTRNRFLTSSIKSEIDLLDLILGKYFFNLEYNEIFHILEYDLEVRGGNKIETPFNEILLQILDLTKSEDYFLSPAKQDQAKNLENQIDDLIFTKYGIGKR